MTRLNWQDASSEVEVVAEPGEEGHWHFYQKECYGFRWYEVVSTPELQAQAERLANEVSK